MHWKLWSKAGLILALPVIGFSLIPAVRGNAAEQVPAVLIEDDFKAGLINYESKIIYQLMSVRDYDRLPSKYKSALPASERPKAKSATFVFREAQDSLGILTPQGQAIVAKYLARPTGTYTYDSPGGHYKLHYNTSGANAVPTTDNNHNGIPDYVENCANYCDSTWRTEIDNLHYMTPPSDGVSGGDSRYDIYFEEMGYYGYTQPEGAGPNPWNDRISFISIHRNFIGFPPNTDPDGDQLGAAKVTIAHEFYHAVQFAYDYGEELWWMEAGSTWMEDVVFDVVNDNYNYLSTFFSSPQTALTDNTFHVYSSFIWPKFLEERFADTTLAKRIWEACRYTTAYNAINDSLSLVGYNFDSALAEFTTWNFVTSTRNDGHHYGEAGFYPAMTMAESQSAYPVAMHIVSAAPQGYGSAYIRFSPAGYKDRLRISFDGSDGVEWAAYIIKSSSLNTHTFEKLVMNPSGWTAVANIDSFQNYYSVTLVAANISQYTGGNSFSYLAQIVPPYSVSGAMITDTLGYSGHGRLMEYSVANNHSESDNVRIKITDSLGWIADPVDSLFALAGLQDSILGFELKSPTGTPLSVRDKLYLSVHSQGDSTVYDSTAEPISLVLQHGDANFDGTISILDITYLINFLYKQGVAPLPELGAGDATCDGTINILDVTNLINSLYKGGPPPPCNPF